MFIYTGELGYDRLNGTRKIGPSYAKSVIYIWQILDMHGTGTKHLVRHRRIIRLTVVRHIQVHLYKQYSPFGFLDHLPEGRFGLSVGSQSGLLVVSIKL